jgi:hypothetical protein
MTICIKNPNVYFILITENQILSKKLKVLFHEVCAFIHRTGFFYNFILLSDRFPGSNIIT